MSSQKVREFKEIAGRLSVGLLGDDRTTLLLLKKSCGEVGIKNFQEFSRGKEAINACQCSSFSMLLILKEIGDMHWATFIRTLRSDPTIDYFPLILFLPRKAEGEQDEAFDKQNLELIESYDVKIVQGVSQSPEKLVWLFDEMIRCEKNVDSIQLQIKSAKDAYSKGMLDQARKTFKEILKERKSIAAGSGLLQTYEKEPEHYLKVVNHLLDKDPENYNFKFKLLDQMMKNRKTIRTKALVSELLTTLRNSDETFWLTSLGEVCVSNKVDMFMDQIVMTLASKVDNRYNWQVPYLQARNAIAKGDLARAEKFLEAAIKATKVDHGELHNMNGIILKRNNHPERAITAFTKAFQLMPDDHRIAYNIGLVYESLEEDELAETYFQTALDLNPGYAKAKAKLES